MTQTAVAADLLQALEVLAQLAVDTVGDDLVVLAVVDVALSVQEPRRDLVLRRVLDDGDDALQFFRGDLTGAADKISQSDGLFGWFVWGRRKASNAPLGQVNIGLLADQVGVAAPDTLDPGQGVHNLLLAIDVGVEQPQNVLEVRLLAGYERCREKSMSACRFHF